jgi:GNAT superfamily N-acetyltransferase
MSLPLPVALGADLTVYTLEQRPDFAADLSALGPKAWPFFVLADNVSREVFERLFEPPFLAYQFVLFFGETLVAAGHSIPLVWDGTLAGLPGGWDGALLQGIADHQAGRQPTTLSALAATIDPAYQGRGLSQHVIRTMRAIAAEHGLWDLIAPVRPSQKARYPLIPTERYMTWRRADGSPFDAWLRTHWRFGAEFLRAEPASMTVTGTVAEWEEWAEMRFPESGSYVVPGALVPITIDREQDLGTYIEPNVWMRHRIPH